MKIVNTSDIPEPIYAWLCQDFYDGVASENSISATGLLKPIQQMVLEKRYWDKLEVDAIDRMWALFGSGIHAVLEKVKDDSAVPIERLQAEVAGFRVNGKFDRIANNEIIDYKVTSAWSVTYSSKSDDWRKQLSIYRYLYYKTSGIMLNDMGKIIAILRDWQEKNVKPNGNYPKKQIVQIEIKLLTIEQVEQFMTAKINMLKEARLLPDDQLPKCTNEERWWNGKRKIYMNCDRYCTVREFCKQNQIKGDNQNGNDEIEG